MAAGRDPAARKPGPAPEPVLAAARMSGAAASRSAGLDPDLLGDFVAAITRVSAARTELSEAELQGYRSLGGQAADAGVPLAGLVDLYLSVTWRLWRHLPAVEAAVSDLGEIQAVGETVLRAAGQAVAAVSDGYQMARQAVIRRQEAARREFIDDLLAGTSDIAGLLARGAGFGLDLTGPHMVAVAHAGEPFTESSALLDRVENALRGRGSPPTLIASKDGLLVVIATVSDPDAVTHITDILTATLGSRTAPSRTWQIGIGRVRPGPAGVLASYQEATDALTLAALLELDTPVVAAADLIIYRVLLRDRAAIADLIITTLGPLAHARGGPSVLMNTLETYLGAGANTAEAARRMHLSVRAVTYRLARIRESTGLDPANPEVRLTLHVAVLGARLLNWPTTPLPTPT